MDENDLPNSKEARVDWVIRAETNDEMRRRYNLWAESYDGDLGSYEDYLVPREATKTAEKILDKGSLILDAGAGTGLVGQCLKEAGFQRLIAADYSEGMLAAARRKGVYQEVHQCDLVRPTHFDDNAMDCVITCGTTSQVPSASLREYARIVRPGGCIIFGVIPDLWIKHGYAEILSELEAKGAVCVESRGAAFQMLPTTEPDLICEMWNIKIL